MRGFEFEELFSVSVAPQVISPSSQQIQTPMMEALTYSSLYI